MWWRAIVVGAAVVLTFGCTGERVSNCPPGSCGPDAAEAPDAAPIDAGVASGAGAGDGGFFLPDGGACPAVAGDHLETLYYAGLVRTYYVHVPTSYDCVQPTAVVFNFHGYTSNALQQIALTGMNSKADAEGFIAVHPEGYLASWNAGACCGAAASQNLDDVGLARTILGLVEQAYNVDPRRVFSTGFSNGGFFSHRLGCEAPDKFAAIAPVSGVMGIPTCKPTRPVPVIDFHGTADPLVPYNGGGLQGFESVSETMDGWRQRDTCQATQSILFQKDDTTCSSYDGCPSGVSVVLCTIDGGTHAWPGAPLGTPTVSATDMLWDFFAAHPMSVTGDGG